MILPKIIKDYFQEEEVESYKTKQVGKTTKYKVILKNGNEVYLSEDEAHSGFCCKF